MTEPLEAFVAQQARLRRPGTTLLDRLREVRQSRGVVGPDDMVRLADELGWPVAAVTGAASFYADVAEVPQGRRHVRICEGTSCFASTRGEHIQALERVLGVRRGTRASDGSVSVQTVRCLGYCYDSPAALDGVRAGTGPSLGGLLDAAAGGGGAGASIGEPPPPIPYRSMVDPPVVLAGLLGGEGAWQVWPQVLTSGSPQQVIREVELSGLRGRGGAGFAVAQKWSMASGQPGPRYAVANGDEGDPGSYCDRLLMEQDPHRVLEGLALAAFAVGARHGLMLVRSEYPAAVSRMGAAVREAREAGHLGRRIHGSGFDFDVEVVEGAGSYVAGEETALMHTLAGLRGDARPRPPYPTTKGFMGRPTVLNNVETLAAVPWVVRHGGAAFARLGHPDEPGTKLVCLSGLFRRPGVYEVEYGVSLRHVVEQLGGGLRDGHTLRAVQVGGPLGGFLGPDQLDLPLLSEPLARAGVPLGHAGLVAFDTATAPAAILMHEWTFGARESCGACAPCRVGTRRGVELAERIVRPGEAAAVLAEQEPLLEVMDVASLCAFGRGVARAVRSLMGAYADDMPGSSS